MFSGGGRGGPAGAMAHPMLREKNNNFSLVLYFYAYTDIWSKPISHLSI